MEKREKRRCFGDGADLDSEGDELKKQCSVSVLLPTKKVICWKTETNQTGDFVNIGARAFKVRDHTIPRTSCDMIREFMATAAWYHPEGIFSDGISYSCTVCG